MRITRRQGLQGLAASAATIAMPAIVSGQEKEIVIGAPNALTGGLGEVGSRGTWGMQIAVDQINKEGGIKSLGGAKLKLVIADTTSENPTQAASITRRMIDQEGAIVLLGAGASAMTLAAQVEVGKIPDPADHRLICRRHCEPRLQIHLQDHPTGRLGVELVDVERLRDVEDRQGGSAAIRADFHEQRRCGPRGAEGAAGTRQDAQSRRTVLAVVPNGSSDPSVAVAPVLRYKPDLIFLGGFTNDLILIIKALRGVGVTAPIFGAGPAGTDSVGKGLGAAGDKFFAPMAWNWISRCRATPNSSRLTRRPIRRNPIRPPMNSSAKGMSSA